MADVFTKGNSMIRPEGKPLVSKILQGLSYTENQRRNKLFGGSAGHCARNSVLMQRIETTDQATVTASSTMYMGIGSAIHEIICDAMFKMGILVFKEYRLWPPKWLNLGGRIDAITDMGDGRLGLVEIKTCGKDLPSKASLEHTQQAQVYALITGIQNAAVLYVSREVGYPTPKMVALPVDTSPEALRYVARQMVVATIAHRENVLPDIPASLTEQACRYCTFCSACWSDDTAGVLKLFDGEWDESMYGAELDEKMDDLILGMPARLEGVVAFLSGVKGAPLLSAA